MSPSEDLTHLGTRLAERLGEAAQVSISGGDQWARPVVDVPPELWPDALLAARDEPDVAADYFDWLSAVDELPAGIRIVAHLWSLQHRQGLLLRSLLAGDQPLVVGTAIAVYPGAAWHERETHEMFGVGFAGNPDLRPLLLPEQFDGHPLRKEFVLASRVAKAWPGAKEPGEAAGGARRRAPARPPGVPDPTVWGPDAAAAQDPEQ